MKSFLANILKLGFEFQRDDLIKKIFSQYDTIVFYHRLIKYLSKRQNADIRCVKNSNK